MDSKPGGDLKMKDLPHGNSARWPYLNLITAVALIISIVAFSNSFWFATAQGDAEAIAVRDRAIIAAASGVVTTILTADPSNIPGYLAALQRVSTGELSDRYTKSGVAIAEMVRAQETKSIGVVVGAGIVDKLVVPQAHPPGINVLVVAEPTNPLLLGGSQGERRIVVLITMREVQKIWKAVWAQGYRAGATSGK